MYGTASVFDDARLRTCVSVDMNETRQAPLCCRRSLSLTEEEWRFVMFIDGKEKGRVDVEIIELKRQS